MKIIWAFLFLSSSIFSQNFIVLDSLDKQLIDLTFNDEHVQVKNICDSLINLDAKNPQNYFHYFGADALQLHEKINDSPLGGRDSVREFLVDQSIEKLEEAIQTLDDIPQTPINQFYIASLHSYYSRYAGLNRYWWAAYVNGTKANGMFEEIIEEFPECYDAYLYPGVFGYYAARLNGFNGFIASILGVSGNRTDGIKFLKLSLEKGKLVYAQALLMMLEINTVMEDNPHKAIPYFEEFIEKYPKNKRVNNWYAHTLLNLNKASRVGNIIDADSLKIIDKFVKAKFYFLTEQLDSSAKYSKCAFQNPKTWKGIIEHTKYYCVYTIWMLNNPEATKTYKSKLNNFYTSLFKLDLNNNSESKYIYKLTTLLAKEKYSEFDKFIESKPNFKNPYFEAEFKLLVGTSLFQQNKLIESLPYFEKAEKSTDRRKRTISLRYQLDIYLELRMPIEKVKSLIERVEETDYSKLIFRIDDLKEKYNFL
ncbi:MAG: hypothetical protein PF445_11455 [Melioribacteraceae bacterium]|jgi:tetratricopeptide (TPR) repeat protein|nr:hypothetical protein [Melioribacteraceae bacterium]